MAASGRCQSDTVGSLKEGKGNVHVAIENPQLWWPAGMGKQPLYRVDVELLHDGKVLDRTTKRIGLRTLRAVPQTAAVPLHFEVNGVPFFAKGANWIPADCFPNRLTKDILPPLRRRRRGGQHEHAAVLGRRILRGRRPVRPVRRAGHLRLARFQVRLLDLPGL